MSLLSRRRRWEAGGFGGSGSGFVQIAPDSASLHPNRLGGIIINQADYAAMIAALTAIAPDWVDDGNASLDAANTIDGHSTLKCLNNGGSAGHVTIPSSAEVWTRTRLKMPTVDPTGNPNLCNIGTAVEVEPVESTYYPLYQSNARWWDPNNAYGAQLFSAIKGQVITQVTRVGAASRTLWIDGVEIGTVTAAGGPYTSIFLGPELTDWDAAAAYWIGLMEWGVYSTPPYIGLT